jgi:phosphoribosylformimino-5-aminoimidazole carboxamide ribotide isomerase
MSKQFEHIGFKRLHVVDLDGAKSRHIVNNAVLHEITTQTKLTVDFGGGIKTDEDLKIAFEAGASMVTIGSLAVTHPETLYLWIEKYGAERFILGADVKHGLISINGWKEEGNESLFPFIEKYQQKGINQVLCTDIARDGMLQGPSIELYKDAMKHFPTLHLIASGGVSGIEDICQLNEAGIPAVVFGKAIYEGKIKLEELKEFIEC